MRELVNQLRAEGYWPHASIETRHRHHDIFGIGDVGLEVTIEAWSEIDRKVRQAKADAASRGVDWWSVIKRRRGARTPLDGYAITEARVLVQLLCRVQQLEAGAEAAEAAFARGLDAGLAASGHISRPQGPAGQDPPGLAC
jgi:hypothetical protein